MIKLRVLRWEDYPALRRISTVIMKVFIRGKQSCQYQRRCDHRIQGQSKREIRRTSLLVLKMEGWVKKPGNADDVESLAKTKERTPSRVPEGAWLWISAPSKPIPDLGPPVQ